jgi:hypothetical protein
MTLAGLPHSEIPGSKRACRSPRHIAACHVLHRLSVPRHPPSTLSNLTIKCLDLMRSAARRLVLYFSTDIHCAFFIYNPYSIVKETQVAKTNAECNPVRLYSPLVSRLLRFVRCGNSNNQKGVGRYFGSAVRAGRRFRRRREGPRTVGIVDADAGCAE